jgi:hypothetical protein
MNHNETGCLQEAIEGPQSFAIPARAFGRQKGKHRFPRASRDAHAQKEIKRTFSSSAYVSGLHSQTQSPIASIARGDVSFGLRAIQHWRIAD